MSPVVNIVVRHSRALPVVLTNEPTLAKPLPESNASVQAIRALEEQIARLSPKETASP